MFGMRLEARAGRMGLPKALDFLPLTRILQCLVFGSGPRSYLEAEVRRSKRKLMSGLGRSYGACLDLHGIKRLLDKGLICGFPLS